MSATVKRTERGWAAHLCVASSCLFHRNTLVEIGTKKFIVSTVGDYRRFLDGESRECMEEIGNGRHYETFVFKTYKAGNYIEADINKQVSIDGVPWSLKKTKRNASNIDNLANEMHENMVSALIKQVTK